MSFYKHYKEKLVPNLKKQLACKNVMEVPRLAKIVLNMGLGDMRDKKLLAKALEEMTLIAGQRAVVTKARKSVAGFSIREGWPIGCKVTLRSTMMYNFLQRLIIVALPRIRDFRGFSVKSFDGQGNYSIGIKEQIVFPEIDYDSIDKINGLDIIFVTDTKSDEKAAALLSSFGFPFKDFHMKNVQKEEA